jgi:hypothetical protein
MMDSAGKGGLAASLDMVRWMLLTKVLDEDEALTFGKALMSPVKSDAIIQVLRKNIPEPDIFIESQLITMVQKGSHGLWEVWFRVSEKS